MVCVCVCGGGVLAFCLSSAPQLPGNSQVGLTHYKRGCLLSLLALLVSCFSLALSQLPTTTTTCSWEASSLLLYFSTLSLSLSALLCLSYALNFSLHALNKLYSILYRRVAGPSGGRDALAWTYRGTPFSFTQIEHILIFIYLIMITTLVP